MGLVRATSRLRVIDEPQPDADPGAPPDRRRIEAIESLAVEEIRPARAGGGGVGGGDRLRVLGRSAPQHQGGFSALAQPVNRRPPTRIAGQTVPVAKRRP